ELERLVRDAYQPGRGYTEAFARLMTSLVGCYGLILLDPLDARLKRLAAPLYAEAAARAPAMAAAIVERSRELVEAGYHAQVHASPDAFPLFLRTDDGARHALVRTDEGSYKVKETEQEFSLEALARWAAREPERFSPNVTLRAVAQDFLLPTVAYFGGAAEIAYFAQTAEVYRLLARPATPILHRASMTIVERRTERMLERYGLSLSDLFAGEETVVARIVEEHLGAETARAFERTEGAINGALDELQEHLKNFEPTLADALDAGRRKINYQLTGLRARFHRAQMARDRAAHRQIERAFTALYPEKTLQERRINIASLLARHGRYIIGWIYDSIDLGSP
ncbi:MAG: bacillithiol biosynthesis cysteine-adding enzyme BshC, partial [Acidobacteria bacterium]|nr:bacillithiol biosynthesis cysteine-adding enzyme BshC [Acidobacteriota bacterium]